MPAAWGSHLWQAVLFDIVGGPGGKRKLLWVGGHCADRLLVVPAPEAVPGHRKPAGSPCAAVALNPRCSLTLHGGVQRASSPPSKFLALGLNSRKAGAAAEKGGTVQSSTCRGSWTAGDIDVVKGSNRQCARERGHGLALAQVPHLDRLVMAARDDLRAKATESMVWNC